MSKSKQYVTVIVIRSAAGILWWRVVLVVACLNVGKHESQTFFFTFVPSCRKVTGIGDLTEAKTSSQISLGMHAVMQLFQSQCQCDTWV